MLQSVDGYAYVLPNLAIGSAPPIGKRLKFDVLILCAIEYPPNYRPTDFPGIFVIHAPMEDNIKGLTLNEFNIVKNALNLVIPLVKNNKKVLVTCYKGLNRSGLVTALILKQLGVSTKEAIDTIRKARGPDALSNASFVKIIANY